MGDHIDGRPAGLAPVSYDTLALGGAVRRGVRSGHGRREASRRCTVNTVPEPPHPVRRMALSRTFRLEADLSSVAVARRYVAAAVGQWSCPVDVDTAILLTSELVANAVTHGGVPGKPVLLAVFDLGGRLHVEVHDPGGRGAGGVECKRPTLDGESGRGLAIVAALADFWDWEPTGWGKVVYFGLSAASEARAA